MNASIHRVGLAVAALAVVVTLAGFFAVDGYLSARGSVSQQVSPAVAMTAPPSSSASLPPEVVYVRPAPSPRVIHITQTAPPAPPKVVHVTVPTAGGEGTDGEGGGEHDGGGD